MFDKFETIEFNINSDVCIRYRRGYGFYILKKINGLYHACFKTFSTNPHALGFKIRRGFGYDDMREHFYESLEDALNGVDYCERLPYFEYNPSFKHEFIKSVDLLEINEMMVNLFSQTKNNNYEK